VNAAEVLGPLAERIDARIAGTRAFAVRFWDGSELPPPGGDSVEVTLVVRSPAALARILREPNEVGLGRAWISGELDVEGDLEQALAAGEAMRGVSLGTREKLAALAAARRLGALRLRPPAAPRSEARLSGHRHSLERDRAAVRHHYDVSNAFFRIVLGPTMVYSCAYFAGPDEELDTAQERKLDVVCRKLRLEPGERFLDVGCGWGALVVHAAERYGVRAVGITLSEPQAEYARERVADAGLADRCEIRVADYREVPDGPFDKIASIGMVEHVGAAKLGDYARTLRALLQPGGLLLNHGITRAAPRGWDDKSFVARFVFPDGELESLGTTVRALELAGLEVRDVESLREHYSLTLRRWLANLAAGREAAIAEAGEERERIWRLYMTGAARTFDSGEISVHQVLTAAPGAEHRLPLARGASARFVGETEQLRDRRPVARGRRDAELGPGEASPEPRASDAVGMPGVELAADRDELLRLDG
jgi:cyclopropane-fatty-acyl-phospholipid synthase